MALLGFSAFIAIIPLFPEITEVVQETYSHMNKQNLYDKVSSLYTNAFAVGNIFGPMVGAHLTDEYGFRTCCDILAFTTLAHFVIYFFIIDGPTFLKTAFNVSDRNVITNEEKVELGKAQKGQNQYADLEQDHELHLEEEEEKPHIHTNGADTSDGEVSGPGSTEKDYDDDSK